MLARFAWWLRRLFVERPGEAIPREVVGLGLVGSLLALTVGILIDGAQFRGYDITVNVLGSSVLVGPGLFITNILLTRWRDRRDADQRDDHLAWEMHRLSQMTSVLLSKPIFDCVNHTLGEERWATTWDMTVRPTGDRLELMQREMIDVHNALIDGVKAARGGDRRLHRGCRLPRALRNWSNQMAVHVAVMQEVLGSSEFVLPFEHVRESVMGVSVRLHDPDLDAYRTVPARDVIGQDERWPVSVDHAELFERLLSINVDLSVALAGLVPHFGGPTGESLDERMEEC